MRAGQRKPHGQQDKTVAEMTASRGREIESTWWDIHTAASFLGCTRRQVDRMLEQGRLPPECTEMVNHVRWFDPSLLTSLRLEMGQQQTGLAKVAPEGSPEAAMAMFWRSAADMLRAQNAAVGENQLHVREMFGAFLENVPLVQGAMRGEIERLQTENAALRTKVMEGFTAVQDAMDRSNERDLAVLVATRREQNFADVMGMLRELAPRLFEQFVGIREVKKQIGKLDEKTLEQVLAVVPDAKAKELLRKIYDDEQARVTRLKDLVGGKKSAPASSTDSSEGREGAA